LRPPGRRTVQFKIRWNPNHEKNPIHNKKVRNYNFVNDNESDIHAVQNRALSVIEQYVPPHQRPFFSLGRFGRPICGILCNRERDIPGQYFHSEIEFRNIRVVPHPQSIRERVRISIENPTVFEENYNSYENYVIGNTMEELVFATFVESSDIVNLTRFFNAQPYFTPILYFKLNHKPYFLREFEHQITEPVCLLYQFALRNNKYLKTETFIKGLHDTTQGDKFSELLQAKVGQYMGLPTKIDT